VAPGRKRQEVSVYALSAFCLTYMRNGALGGKVGLGYPRPVEVSTSEVLGHASAAIDHARHPHVLPDMQDSAVDAMEAASGPNS
jgi:hypothetical protein